MDDETTRRAADSDVAAARQQQHTGNHDPQQGDGPDRFGGTRAGAENVEPAGPVTTMTYTVTRDDAAEVGREAAVYARQLGEALRPYGVTVRLAPGQRGRGYLAGCNDPKLEVDIRQAIAMVNTEPGSAG